MKIAQLAILEQNKRNSNRRRIMGNRFQYMPLEEHAGICTCDEEFKYTIYGKKKTCNLCGKKRKGR